jgi:hypothetical protein
MSGKQRSVEVYIDVDGAGGPARMGTLHAQSSGRQEVLSFEYASEWLGSEAVFAFDPDLQLLEGAQYPAQSRSNFGIFLDSAPDRWGRLLMQRRENLRARQEERPVSRLTEWDYLLGVHDEPGWVRSGCDRSKGESLLIATGNGLRLRSLLFANCRRPAMVSNGISMTKKVLNTHAGLTN